VLLFMRRAIPIIIASRSRRYLATALALGKQ
jgi:hypothetical protein